MLGDGTIGPVANAHAVNTAGALTLLIEVAHAGIGIEGGCIRREGCSRSSSWDVKETGYINTEELEEHGDKDNNTNNEEEEVEHILLTAGHTRHFSINTLRKSYHGFLNVFKGECFQYFLTTDRVYREACILWDLRRLCAVAIAVDACHTGSTRRHVNTTTRCGCIVEAFHDSGHTSEYH